MILPSNFENHPLNANNKAILRKFVLESGYGAISEDSIEMRVNALHDFLLDYTDVKTFDDSVYLESTDNRLSYEQYAKKEYYHDGSEQYRMILHINLISKAEYEYFAEGGSKEATKRINPMCEIHTKWLNECTDYYYGWFDKKWLGNGQIGKEYCFFAKGFLKCFDYVRIECYTWH